MHSTNPDPQQHGAVGRMHGQPGRAPPAPLITGCREMDLYSFRAFYDAQGYVVSDEYVEQVYAAALRSRPIPSPHVSTNPLFEAAPTPRNML